MLQFLGNDFWQGIGAIAGIISIIVSLWLARKPSEIRAIDIARIGRTGWRVFGVILSLLIPIYAIFVGSILFVNHLTTDGNSVVYGTTAVASLFGLIWGIVWAMYIQKAFFVSNNQRTSRKLPIKGT